MLIQLPFGSPNFELVAKGLVELHHLIKEGKEESSEAESIRDGLDAPLMALNRVEKKRAQWLSEDLYSVSEPDTAAKKEMNPQAQQQLISVYEARQRGEWDRALELLRRWKEYIAPALLSYLRGSIWLEARAPYVAAVFYGHASENDPSNANYLALYMHSLEASGADFAGSLAKRVLADDEAYAPVVVARAAEIRLKEAKGAADVESVHVYRELIPILQRNMTRIENDENTESRSSAYGMSAGLLGFCCEFVGDMNAAVNSYSRGLKIDPNNDAILVARGILLYGTSPRAIADFEQAVALHTPVVFPRLFLAHYYLITNRFEECRNMCESALKMPASNTAKSLLQQWRAISQAELGFPRESVLEAFEAAVRLDPSDESAKRNQAAFEASLSHTPHSAWEQVSAGAIRQIGLAERRYALAA